MALRGASRHHAKDDRADGEELVVRGARAEPRDGRRQREAPSVHLWDADADRTADRLAATIQACRAYVGARIHDPARADLLLRLLRRRAFSQGQPLDQLETIHGAGADAGIAPDTLDAWLADEHVERALREDMAATRAPLPEALALAHRLSRSNGGLRYSTASAVFERDRRRVVMPGFQPFAVYDVAVANVAPKLERRPPPQTVEEVLSWAPYPLATAEVAELRGIGLEQAREELQRAGAKLVAVPDDGYWSIG